MRPPRVRMFDAPPRPNEICICGARVDFSPQAPRRVAPRRNGGTPHRVRRRPTCKNGNHRARHPEISLVKKPQHSHSGIGAVAANLKLFSGFSQVYISTDGRRFGVRTEKGRNGSAVRISSGFFVYIYIHEYSRKLVPRKGLYIYSTLSEVRVLCLPRAGASGVAKKENNNKLSGEHNTLFICSCGMVFARKRGKLN